MWIWIDPPFVLITFYQLSFGPFIYDKLSIKMFLRFFYSITIDLNFKISIFYLFHRIILYLIKIFQRLIYILVQRLRLRQAINAFKNVSFLLAFHYLLLQFQDGSASLRLGNSDSQRIVSVQENVFFGVGRNWCFHLFTARSIVF